MTSRNKVEVEFEPDSSPKTWEYYKKIYTPTHWPFMAEFEFGDIETRKNRLLLKLFEKSNYSRQNYLGHKFRLGGDCDFNFNEKKRLMFNKLLEKKSDKDLLEACCKMHHNPLNFSLMPVTGGMNNVKGRLYVTNIAGVNFSGSRYQKCYDRLDTFIYCIDHYFKGKSKLIFCCCSEVNESCLKNYLSLFDDIYDYCKKVYFVTDRELVRKLLNNGGSPINDDVDVRRYMNLALEFWEAKKEVL